MLGRDVVVQIDALARALMRACETPAVAGREELCLMVDDAAESLLALLDHIVEQGLVPDAPASGRAEAA